MTGSSSRFSWKKLLLGGGAAGLLALHLSVVYLLPAAAHNRSVSFGESDQGASVEAMPRILKDDSFAALPPAVPFRELAPPDEDANSWSNVFSLFGGAGATVFDANGDGRLDVYLVHDGQNWTRPTDADAVLMDKPRSSCNGLYLNQGNDEKGDPRFVQVNRLADRNATFQKEELLVEDFLFPRSGPADSAERPGRQSNLALAVDINGDGLQDLLVGNQPPGMIWSHPSTQAVLSRFVDPIGRQARHSKQPLAGLGAWLVPYTPRESTDDTRESARGAEPQGANSLYLNRGDQDGDGLPEWEDASRAAGIEGRRSTYGLSAADIDLDGDLDIYEANVHDLDFWPGAAKKFAGAINALYINRLAETGQLRFEEQGEAFGVTGELPDAANRPTLTRLDKLGPLPYEYSIAAFATETYKPDLLEIDGRSAEDAEISWATVMQDVNSDGFPDIWVANDLGYLRLYLNRDGKRFEVTEHARSKLSGSWMSFAPADYSGDLKEDLVAGNVGGGGYSHEFISPSWYDLIDPVINDSLAFRTLVVSGNDFTHTLIDGADIGRELPHKVRHSQVLPPDSALPNNLRPMNIKKASFIEDFTPFDVDSLDPYEFAWGMAPIDVQNDGWIDMYWLGALWNRGGGIMSSVGTNPGRLLINATRPGGEVRWVDMTAEYHAFNILELVYDQLAERGYVWRRSPSQNWSKRDRVYSYDRSVWVSQGVGIQERVANQDLIQTAEFGKAAVAADLNGDGFQDLLLTNVGGYDSRASNNKNLKARIDGKPQVLPAPDYNYPTLTNFEPGRTRLLINDTAEGAWMEVRLIDDSPGTWNRDAIGAQVIVNGHLLRVKRAGDGSHISNSLANLHFGLGAEAATTIEIRWPDRSRTVTTLPLAGLQNGVLTVRRSVAAPEWTPRTADAAAPVPAPGAPVPAPGAPVPAPAPVVPAPAKP